MDELRQSSRPGRAHQGWVTPGYCLIGKIRHTFRKKVVAPGFGLPEGHYFVAPRGHDTWRRPAGASTTVRQREDRDTPRLFGSGRASLPRAQEQGVEEDTCPTQPSAITVTDQVL
jgi:hypothetical protein